MVIVSSDLPLLAVLGSGVLFISVVVGCGCSSYYVVVEVDVVVEGVDVDSRSNNCSVLMV